MLGPTIYEGDIIRLKDGNKYPGTYTIKSIDWENRRVTLTSSIVAKARKEGTFDVTFLEIKEIAISNGRSIAKMAAYFPPTPISPATKPSSKMQIQA